MNLNQETDFSSAGTLFKLEWGGETLDLLPDRGVWQATEKTLFVADTHFGKEATFRAAGIPIPDVTASDLERLTRMIGWTRCRRLTFLGDLLHARSGLATTLVDQIAHWRRGHQEVDMLLVRGNHDRQAGDPPACWGMRCCDESTSGRLRLLHQSRAPGNGPTLVGHLHPKHRSQWGAESLTLPCFFLQDPVLVLPAFGSFVDGQVMKKNSADRLFVIADREVLEVKC